jgi:hypothetical protein
MKKINNTPITCQLCNKQETIHTFRSHLRWNHKEWNSDKYALQFGEFRPKYILNQLKKDSSNLICLICNEKMNNQSQLMHHLTKKHKDITKEEYTINYVLEKKRPVCACGCNNYTEFLPSWKDDNGEERYFRKYIKGHWDWIKPGYFEHTHNSKMKIREARIKILQQGNFFQKISEDEIELQNFIKSYIPENKIEFNNRELLHGKEIDIYIPELKLAIEYNGVYFHSDKFKSKTYHSDKTKECNDLGIRVVHIWEGDWKYKQDIIKSNLLNIIGKTPNKIYARKCEIREVSSKECIEFLTNNHLQGNCNSKIRIGLYYNNELVSIMTFGKYRKSLGKIAQVNEYELLRFCNKLNYTIIGGASKLFNYFIKNYNPVKILSYANRDWSNGNLYKILGFKLLNITEPGYWYYKGRIKYNRFNFRKDILVKQGYDVNKTEFEIMDSKGYLRVWDCGNFKFEWN